MHFYKATTQPTTTTPDRVMVGYMEECGNHSTTGYCGIGNSACMPSADDVIWRCRCIPGFVMYQNICQSVDNVDMLSPVNITMSTEDQFQDKRIDVPDLMDLNFVWNGVDMYPSSAPFVCELLNDSFYLSSKHVLEESRYVFTLVLNAKHDFETFDVVLDMEILVPRQKQVIIYTGTPANQTILKISDGEVENVKLNGSYQFAFKFENGVLMTDDLIDFNNWNIPNALVLRTSLNVTIEGTNFYLCLVDIYIVPQLYKRNVKEGVITNIGSFEVGNIYELSKITLHDPYNIFFVDGYNLVISNRTDYENGVTQYDISTSYEQVLTNIRINIEDENDNDPVFSESGGYTFSLSRSLTPVVVGVVSASDVDTLGVLQYSIIQLANASSNFDIDSNGILSAKSLIKEYSFQVVVSDGTNTASTDVNVIIERTTDKRLNMNFSASIDEGLPNGSYVGNVKISGYVNYRINYNPKFDINNDTGIVTTTEVLDREIEDVYQLTVSAFDNTGISCSIDELGILQVTVLDINDNRPKFSENSYTAEVRENETNAFVKLDKAFDVTDNDEAPVITYSLEDDFSGKFRIDSISGEIFTSVALNREARDSYILGVVANDSLYTDTASVNVTVTDINDNIPGFIFSNRTFVIPEGSQHYNISAAAEDDDLGQNGTVRYFIQDTDGFFIIDERTGEITLTTQSLDREKRDSHSFTCTACDQGVPELCNTATFQIIVSDVNDESPTLLTPTEPVIVSENVNCSINVTYTDLDIGLNGALTYSLLNHQDIFEINRTTGMMKCKKQLDYENPSERRFELVVSATDGGVPPNSKNDTIIVNVNDENDNYPEFIGNVLTYEVRRSYFSDTSKPIALISAVDADSGSNGILEYAVIGGNGSSLVEIDQSNGFLQTKNVAVDLKGFYAVTIRAQDQGIPPESNNITILINIQDVTVKPDQDISFNSTVYNFYVLENVTQQQQLANMNNFINNVTANVTFGFAGVINDGGQVSSTNGGFYLMRDSGALFINGSYQFDREEQDTYRFVVIASDAATNDIALIVVNLMDVNDNDPVFDRNLYVFILNENDPNASSRPTAVRATDEDTGVNGEISYEISSQDACASLFEITQDNYVQAKESLDYETFQPRSAHLCELKVKAFNPYDISRRSETNVHIYVRDINDNAPIFYVNDGFYNVTESQYSITVSENMNVRQVVKFGWISDADTNENQEFSLFIANGDSCPFRTDNGTAPNNNQVTLKLSEAVDYETHKMYTCVIVARDRMPPQLSSSVNVSITVEDYNDNDPEVHGGPFNFTVKRDVSLGYVIVETFNVTDADTGMNAEILFSSDSSVSAWQFFNLSETDGTISVIKSLIELQEDIVTLPIVVSDKGDIPRATTFEVLVEILDENFRPYFSITSYTAYVIEHTEDVSPLLPDTNVYKAKDTVKSSTGESIQEICNCSYRFADPISALFVINGTNGIVKLQNGVTLDREVTDQYNLSILATDRGDPRQDTTNTFTIYVKVQDINDQVPTFSQSIITVDTPIFQAIPPLEPVYKISATDRDIGENAVTKYQIDNVSLADSQRHLFTEPLMSLFFINENSFELYTNGSFEVNITATFDIFVDIRAIDSGDPEKFGTTRLVIPVRYNDTNGYRPKFTQDTYETTLSNNALAGDEIIRVYAYDNDTDAQNNVITYEITAGNVRDTFGINNTGKIFLKYAPDSSITMSNSIPMIVIAKDNGILPKTGTCTVVINIDPGLLPCSVSDKSSGSVSEEYEYLMYSFVGITVVLLIASSVLIYKCCTVPRHQFKLSDLQHYRPKSLTETPKPFDSEYLGTSVYNAGLTKPYSSLQVTLGSPPAAGYEGEFNTIDEDRIDSLDEPPPPPPPDRPPPEPAIDYDREGNYHLQDTFAYERNTPFSFINHYR